MTEQFAAVFGGAFVSILQVFFVALAAGLLVRMKLVTQEHIQGLSTATVVVFLPCLIFANVTENFDTGRMTYWWVLPLSAVLLMGMGLLLGGALFARELPQKKDMLSIAAIQNAGYLVLPVGKALFPDRFEGEFAILAFLFILGNSPLLWSVGKYLVSSDHREPLRLRALISPPFVANIAAVVFVFTELRGAIPRPVGASLKLMGEAAVPVATFVLGASLGGVRLRVRPYLWDAVRALSVKLMLLPLLTILILRALHLDAAHDLLGACLVIQAASAPAAATILQVRSYGGNEEKISSLIFLAYLLCAVTLPFWYAIWVVSAPA